MRTYDLKNEIGSVLYRIKNIFEDWNVKPWKTIYSATYYFSNGKPIKIIGENIKYSNASDILKQGLNFQDHYYKEKQ